MNNVIATALEPLIGLPCWAIGRSVSVFWFHFGEQREVPRTRRGITIGTKSVGTYALHIQCAWRIVTNTEIVVASADRFFPAGDDPFIDQENFEQDQPGANRCDERIAAHLAMRTHQTFVVEAIHVYTMGAFHIRFSDGYTLEVFPDHTLDFEYWRLFRPAMNDPHFVVSGTGVELE